MVEMDVSTFSSACSSVLEEVQRSGHPVLITRSGEPLAQIVPAPVPSRPEHWVGSFRSTGKIVGDIVAPASEEEDWDVLRT
jgi:prevent-host-death family protein